MSMGQKQFRNGKPNKMAPKTWKLARNCPLQLRLPIPHWLVRKSSVFVWIHVFESRQQSRDEAGVGIGRKLKIDEVTIDSVVVAPEALLKSQRRAKLVHIQVFLVDNKPSAADPIRGYEPPALRLDDFARLVLKLLANTVLVESTPDGFFSFSQRVGAFKGHG